VAEHTTVKLARALEAIPGWRSTPDGLHMKMPEAAETMRDLGFPS
jgi:hypothetical protein